jgi:hypothetical protein
MDECKPLARGHCGGCAGAVRGGHARQGRAVQVERIKPTSRAPGTKRLKPKYDEPLSNFAFIFNLRRQTKARSAEQADLAGEVCGRGLHSLPFPLKFSLLCPFPLNLS